MLCIDGEINIVLYCIVLYILLKVHIILLKLFQVLMLASFYFSMPVIFEILIGEIKKETVVELIPETYFDRFGSVSPIELSSPDSELIQTCLYQGLAERNLKIIHIIVKS